MKTLLMLVLLSVFVASSALTAAAPKPLTPEQRIEMLREVKGIIKKQQADLQVASDQLVETQQALKQAQANVALSQGQIKTLGEERDAWHARSDKNEAVVTKGKRFWGGGFILLGIQDIGKHLMWTLLIGGGIMILLYALSFAFPFIGVALSVITKLFRIIFGAVTNVILAIENHMKPKP